MVLCHCRALSDREIRWSILAGATDLDTIAEACGAGADCGGCRPGIVELLRGIGPAAPVIGARRSA